jgi:hypothetical protein
VLQAIIQFRVTTINYRPDQYFRYVSVDEGQCQFSRLSSGAILSLLDALTMRTPGTLLIWLCNFEFQF